MRGTIVLTLATTAIIGLNAMTVIGHFAATAPAAAPPTASAIGFADFDLARFDAAVARGGAVVVQIPDPDRPGRSTRAPGDAVRLTLSPAACPGVAEAIDAWDRGTVVVYAGGAEFGRVGGNEPDYAVEALLRRLKEGGQALPRSAPGAQP
jgi:hypothetical protein